MNMATVVVFTVVAGSCSPAFAQLSGDVPSELREDVGSIPLQLEPRSDLAQTRDTSPPPECKKFHYEYKDVPFANSPGEFWRKQTLVCDQQ
jgi:hypothetical protein